jgi:hypothetical protein
VLAREPRVDLALVNAGGTDEVTVELGVLPR